MQTKVLMKQNLKAFKFDKLSVTTIHVGGVSALVPLHVALCMTSSQVQLNLYISFKTFHVNNKGVSLIVIFYSC